MSYTPASPQELITLSSDPIQWPVARTVRNLGGLEQLAFLVAAVYPKAARMVRSLGGFEQSAFLVAVVYPKAARP